MFKKILLVVSLMLASCSIHQATPIQPTPEVVVVPDHHLRSNPVVMKEYKGETWQISFPDTFIVAKSNPFLKAFDNNGNMLGFAGQKDGATLEHFTQETIMKFMLKGLQPIGQSKLMVDGWNANMIGFSINTNKTLSLVLFTTGEHEYVLVYVGLITQENATIFANVITSIKVSDIKSENK